MNSAENAKGSEGLQAGLPTKITVIVFWGLVWAGAILSLVVLKDIKQQLSDQYTSRSEQLTRAIEQRFKDNPNLAPATLHAELPLLLKKYQLDGVEIKTDKHAIVSGKTGPQLSGNRRQVFVEQTSNRGKFIHVAVSTFHPNLDDAVFNERKEFLVGMAIWSLLYGLLLVWILKKILTKPFISMINTAHEATLGNTKVRFDDSRQDEFGYLAKFVNRLTDQLLMKQNELFEEKERAEVTLHSIGDAVITTHSDGKIIYFNPVAEQLTGFNNDAVINKPITSVMNLVDDRNDSLVANPVETCLHSGKAVALADHAVLARPDGSSVAIAHSASPIRDRAGNIIGAVMVFHDVSEARKLHDQLSYQASHDALTDLYNRREFEMALEYTLMEAKRDNSEHALCYIDLDQFKIVNDTCGHVAGDELLQQLSGLLSENVRHSDVLARLGGDEFGVLFKFCSMENAELSAAKLRNVVSDFTFVWRDHSFNVSASIGLVSLNKESRAITDVLASADVACYAAKDAGRDKIHVYAPDDEELKQRHGEMQWVPRIKEALAQDRFILYYQLIMPTTEDTSDCKRFEVLVRMLGNNDEVIPPMAFIPAAERYDLMGDIDRWVIRNAFKHIQKKASQEKWFCSINLSGQSLCKQDFLSYVLKELADSGIDAGSICFEITETAAIANLNEAIEFITTLKEHGCSFSLDDFGSGLSSFAYLKNLKVDYLKIDGGFVKNIVSDPINRAMVDAINDIGHVMDIKTVAEFVENQAIMDALKNMGVDYVQGYGIHTPSALDELLPLINAKKNLAS